MASTISCFLSIFCLTRILFSFCNCDDQLNNLTVEAELVGLTFESEAEKSNQKQYVDLLIAKVLAQGKDAIDNNEISRTGHDSTSFKHVNSNSPEAFLSSYLRQISNSELGVTAMQEIFDSLPFIEVKENSTQLLHEIIQKLHRKFADYLVVLHQNTLFLEKNFGKSGFPFHMKKLPCCHVQAELLRYNEHFGVDIATHRGCDSHLYNNASDEFYAGFLLTSVLKDRLDSLPTLLWQYFISIDGNQFEYPAYSATDSSRDCKLLSDRHREAFQSTIRSAKQVIVVLEQGYALSNAQFETAKGVAKHVLSLLTAYDKVTILGLAADVQYSSGSNCPSQKLVHASPGTKFLLNRFIDSLDRKQNITNHVLGFTKIFELISLYEQGNKTIPGDILIAYISRGLLSSLIDAKQVLEIIADGSRKSRSSVVINTYAIIDDEKPVMLEKPFLKDVAEQNFRNYNIHFRNKQKIKMLAACMQRATFSGIAHIHQRFTLNQFVALSYNFIAFWQFRAIPKDMPHYVPSWQKGQMIPINSTKNLAAKIGNIFGAFPSVLQTNPVFSLPYWDPVSKGMIISITKQVIHSGKLVGIMGIDVSLADVAEDFVTFFNYKRPSYVFLTDTSGIALIHPSLSHPPFANEHQTHTYIWHLEDSPCFKNLSLTILREPNGTQFLPHRMRNASDIGSLIPVEELSIYKWQKIENTPYIVCMVSKGQTKHRKALRDNTIPDVISFTYHRLDLLPVTSICRHMKQLSSLGVMALFLSSSCFVSPYKYLVEDETRQMVQKYMAYLTDTTKLIANPGLKPGIRSEVLATSWILPTWERASHNDKFSDYIVRRYIATASGVFQVYPATLIDKLYDATRRDWYLRALDHPGRIILTAPYLDIGGAGYVVTLSHTIFEGKPAAMHNSFDNVVAVMGLDFTFGYFYKLLLDKVPICRGEKIICFLLDDRGYLIAHPDLIEPTGRGPVEQQHITHKEPLVANDLLNHKEFVSKKVCNSFSDRTIQRYYQLNTSLQGVLKNHVHGEHCTKYHVMAIPGTNIFLGIVNRTCDGITAFCPCSVTDRLCLNCHRMEPTECECPCECPLALDLCSGKLINESNRYPTCPQFPEEPNLPLVDQVFLEALPPCYEYHCSARTELRDCFGILGCEWCQLEADGTTPLLDKYCTDQRKCFGGILGARTPYADEIIDGIPVEQYLIFKSPVGPVAGGFMVFFLVMALAVYCYRNRVRRGNASQYSISLPDTNLRMTQLNNEPDEPEMFHEAINPVIPACQLIPRADSIVVSPYRVHTNYRRPAGGDSDHGYSTMTPHEDSEHMPYFEPLLIGKDKFFVPASQQSLSSCSRTSSPMSHYPQTLPPVTYIGSPSKTKTDTCVPPWSSKKDAMRSHGSHMVAQVEVHSENVH